MIFYCFLKCDMKDSFQMKPLSLKSTMVKEVKAQNIIIGLAVVYSPEVCVGARMCRRE